MHRDDWMALGFAVAICIIVPMIYFACFNLSYSENELSGVVGGIIQGLFVFVGATLVIFAAKIQADGIDRQIEANKAEKIRRENMEYLGWLELTTNDLYRQILSDKSRNFPWNQHINLDRTLSPHKDPNQIDMYIPQKFIIDNESRHLYVKLPQELKDFLNAEPDPYQILIKEFERLKWFIVERGYKRQPDISLEKIINNINTGWSLYFQKFEEGFKMIKPHINKMRVEMRDNGVTMNY
jgi:uncharacterized membrane protein